MNRCKLCGYTSAEDTEMFEHVIDAHQEQVILPFIEKEVNGAREEMASGRPGEGAGENGYT